MRPHQRCNVDEAQDTSVCGTRLSESVRWMFHMQPMTDVCLHSDYKHKLTQQERQQHEPCSDMKPQMTNAANISALTSFYPRTGSQGELARQRKGQSCLFIFIYLFIFLAEQFFSGRANERWCDGGRWQQVTVTQRKNSSSGLSFCR